MKKYLYKVCLFFNNFSLYWSKRFSRISSQTWYVMFPWLLCLIVWYFPSFPLLCHFLRKGRGSKQSLEKSPHSPWHGSQHHQPNRPVGRYLFDSAPCFRCTAVRRSVAALCFSYCVKNLQHISTILLWPDFSATSAISRMASTRLPWTAIR